MKCSEKNTKRMEIRSYLFFFFKFVSQAVHLFEIYILGKKQKYGKNTKFITKFVKIDKKRF